MIGLAMMLATVPGPDPRCAARVGFYHPPHGVISSPEVAARVAEAYLDAIYGKKIIDRELPLKVSIQRGVWHVSGKDLPTGWVGGVAEIDLCQTNGQVLRVVHG
jgi:hypothetical protein